MTMPCPECARLRDECDQAARRIAELERSVADSRNATLEEAEDAMLGVFSEMDMAYLFTSGFDYRIISARNAIRALKR